jgi:hypothetical protein
MARLNPSSWSPPSPRREVYLFKFVNKNYSNLPKTENGGFIKHKLGGRGGKLLLKVP